MTLTIDEEARRLLEKGKCFKECEFYDKNRGAILCVSTNYQCHQQWVKKVRLMRKEKRQAKKVTSCQKREK